MISAMNQAGYRRWNGVDYICIDWEHCNASDPISETIQLRNLLRRAAAKL